jgi:RHS repeat-associated protein
VPRSTLTSVGHSCQDPANDLAWEAAGRCSGAAANSYGFGASRSEDGDIGLSFFRNRWYDARLGRFTQEDPLGYAGGENLYGYASNNPVTFTDPFGLCPVCDIADVGFFLGAPARRFGTRLGRI